MNIPTKAQAILRRMSRRGYKRQSISVRPDHPYYVYVGFINVTKPNGTRPTWYSSDGKSILACCRDIEKQWRVEQ